MKIFKLIPLAIGVIPSNKSALNHLGYMHRLNIEYIDYYLGYNTSKKINYNLNSLLNVVYIYYLNIYYLNIYYLNFSSMEYHYSIFD